MYYMLVQAGHWIPPRMDSLINVEGWIGSGPDDLSRKQSRKRGGFGFTALSDPQLSTKYRTASLQDGHITLRVKAAIHQGFDHVAPWKKSGFLPPREQSMTNRDTVNAH
jgi:hypothetical protein